MKTFISIAVLFSCISIAYGIQCYVCNSHKDPACGDFFHAESNALKSSYLRSCTIDINGREPFCRKTKTFFEVAGEVRIHRDCGYMRRDNYDCYQQRAEDYTSDVCQCFDNYCNGATANVVAAITLLVPFAIAAML